MQHGAGLRHTPARLFHLSLVVSALPIGVLVSQVRFPFRILIFYKTRRNLNTVYPSCFPLDAVGG